MGGYTKRKHWRAESTSRLVAEICIGLRDALGYTNWRSPAAIVAFVEAVENHDLRAPIEELFRRCNYRGLKIDE